MNKDLRPSDLRKTIQALLKEHGYYAGAIDGDFGPVTYAAIRKLDVDTDVPVPSGWVHGKASSFADPADVARFRLCKAHGGTDMQCFKVGDNGVGYWGDDTTMPIPMCALPRDDWREFGDAARGKKVAVQVRGKEIVCELRDTLPWKRNIKNGVIIDLNPAAVKLLGMSPPILVTASWKWA